MNYRDTLEKEVNALYFFSKCHSGGGVSSGISGMVALFAPNAKEVKRTFG